MKKDSIIFRLTPDESEMLLSSIYGNVDRLKRFGVNNSNPSLFSQYCKLSEKLADVIGNNKFRILLATL